MQNLPFLPPNLLSLRLSWGLESRLQFIDFRLRWERRINRMDLTEHFGISVPQASLDISKYMELAPSNLTYDRSSKTYTAAQSFHPLYQRSSAQRYLAELLATKMELSSRRPASSAPRRRQIGPRPLGARSMSRPSKQWCAQSASRNPFW